jgi:hypothetical protein
MYGMINSSMRRMVIEQHGEEFWASLVSDFDLPDDFSTMHIYPDDLTYRFVSALGERLSVAPEFVLESFGRFFIRDLRASQFGSLLRIFGPDFRQCVSNLNMMHEHMGGSFEGMIPPRFDIEEMGPNDLLLKYYSQRPGLESMVTGLLAGLAEFYDENITLHSMTLSQDQEGNPVHLFHLTLY